MKNKRRPIFKERKKERKESREKDEKQSITKVS